LISMFACTTETIVSFSKSNYCIINYFNDEPNKPQAFHLL
jgi:hypothetical protein